MSVRDRISPTHPRATMEPQKEAREHEPALPMMGDLLAVIESAKARGGTEMLERWIRKRLPESTNEEVSEAADVCVEIMSRLDRMMEKGSFGP